MLFCGGSGQWLKPVCKMCNAFAFRPGPDAVGDLVGDSTVNFLTRFNGTDQAFIASSLRNSLAVLSVKTLLPNMPVILAVPCFGNLLIAVRFFNA